MSTTFAVDKVTPCTQKLTSSELKDRFNKLESGQVNYHLSSHHNVKHSFIDAVYGAYCQHYPLELSADDFWVLIAHGVSKHINSNPDKYRSLLVSHEGKKELEVRVEKYGIIPRSNNEKGWPLAIKEMVEKIKDDANIHLASLLTSPFSTTGPIEQTVLNSTLMDSLKNYYSYRFTLRCGLPSVTLHGTKKRFPTYDGSR